MDNNKRMASGDNPRSVEETHHQPLSDNRNPLLNDVVLTRLFELCHASDLPRFRLVSKKWLALASDGFRRDVPVAFESPWSRSDRLRFESFFELYPEKIPFGYFRMKDMHIGQLEPPVDSETPIPVEFVTYRQNIEQFWGRYGSCIRKLELWRPVVHSVEAFKKLILEETPNLEELSLFHIKDKTGNPSPSANFDGGDIGMQLKLKRLVVDPLCCWPFGWNLLRHFPKIQGVEVSPRYGNTIFKDNGTVARHLREILEQTSTKQRPCLITVPELEFSIRSQADASVAKTLLQIPQLSFPKLHFTVDLSDRDCEMDLLSTAIGLHGKNLEYLYVASASRHLPYDNFLFKHGPFNSTTSIKLRGSLCENLHFLLHFPNLKSLHMDTFGTDLLKTTDLTVMETFTLQALKDLHLVMGFGYITKDKMEMLVKVMPRVETFHGRLINESFRVLCREWNQLKDLFVAPLRPFHLRINDEGITGMLSGSEERLPNITDLEALKSFSYHGKDLSDSSIWNGFLQMPNLENLSVIISPDASENAFRALIKKFHGSPIIRSSDNEGSIFRQYLQFGR